MRAPMCGQQFVVRGLGFDGYTSVDDGNQVRGAEIVQHVAGNWPVDAAEEYVTVQGSTIRRLLVHVHWYGKDVYVVCGRVTLDGAFHYVNLEGSDFVGVSV